MGFVTEQCPRCFSTKGFTRREYVGEQRHLDGLSHSIDKKKKVPVCRGCGRWSHRKDIIKHFSH